MTGLAASSGGGFSFIGSSGQSGARQVQVIQDGNAATVFVYIGNDPTAELVISVTVADGHTLTAADFAGPVAQEADPVKSATADDIDAFIVKHAGDFDLAGFNGAASNYLDMARARDFGGLEPAHVSYDLDLFGASFDFVM